MENPPFEPAPPLAFLVSKERTAKVAVPGPSRTEMPKRRGEKGEGEGVASREKRS
jgi:hypothetical protein